MQRFRIATDQGLKVREALQLMICGLEAQRPTTALGISLKMAMTLMMSVEIQMSLNTGYHCTNGCVITFIVSLGVYIEGLMVGTVYGV